MAEFEGGGYANDPTLSSLNSPAMTPISVESCPATERDQLMSDSTHKNLDLYEDEDSERPFVSRIINHLATYGGGVMPPPAHQEAPDMDVEEAPEVVESDGKRKKKQKQKAASAPKSQKLGTILGVYFPCIQNIFGVILFIRLVWIIGVAGWLQAFCIVFMCCCCTMTTSISMSAIATNGVVPGGGSYFMISRSLGAEFGGAVGILFYLGTTVAASMYIIGAIEILLQYLLPDEAALFGPISIPANAYNSYRVYGTALLITMFICVFVGVKFVSIFSPIALFCVLGSICCVYIGIFTANGNSGPQMCVLGDRVLNRDMILDSNGVVQCNKTDHGVLLYLMCGNGTSLDEAENSDDEDCNYFIDNNVELKRGIPGISSRVFMENMWSHHSSEGNRIGSTEKGNRLKGDIIADISTTMIILIGIFFPSVTGIMAGSNRSGDLEDAQKSIPIGTIGACATTSIVYLSCTLLFAATVEGQFLRDKFGASMGGGLIVAEMSVPHPMVIVVGSFLSTCGAGLQSLTGAPRLLQAIAADGVIPFLNAFAVTNDKGEPRRALYLTAAIAEAGVLLANVDIIAPIITMFFLMCYCFTNLACAVQTILKSPNWRPRFRLYHWSLSLFGVVLCLIIMFLASWYFALMAIAIAAFIYKYIEYKGAEKEWGDGIRGLAMSAARYALLRLEEGQPHVKNWRPQLLILLKPGQDLEPKYRKLLTFSSQLKAGKGLTIVASVLEGEHKARRQDTEVTKQKIADWMKRERVKGFIDVVASRNVGEAVGYLLQGAGLGGLRHNAVLMHWPRRGPQDSIGYQHFLEWVRIINERHLALVLLKGIDQFPENGDRLGGTIDVWWIVHDGGLLMLLPFLLVQGKVWKKCKMRIFTVAQMEDNSVQMKKDLEKFLYQLRISAEVVIVEMSDQDIAAYTYGRTLEVEQRNAMLEKLKLPRNSITPQMIVDQAHPLPMRPQSPIAESATPPPTPPSTPSKHSPPHDSSLPPPYVTIDLDQEADTHTEDKTDVHTDTQEDTHIQEDDRRSSADVVPNGSPEHFQPDQSQNAEHIHSDQSQNAENFQPDLSHEAVHFKPDQSPKAEHFQADKPPQSPEPPASKYEVIPVNEDSATKCVLENHHDSVTVKVVGGKKGFEHLEERAGQSFTPPSTSSDATADADHRFEKSEVRRETSRSRRMHTASSLNKVIQEHSLNAKLVILNLPNPPKNGEENYLDFLEALTNGLSRVIMVRGGGNEVITIFS